MANQWIKFSISDEAAASLEAYAASIETPVSSIARMWTMERLQVEEARTLSQKVMGNMESFIKEMRETVEAERKSADDELKLSALLAAESQKFPDSDKPKK